MASKITREEVFAACYALKAAGKSVTLVNVRERMGGGSFSTLSPLVKEWATESQAEDQASREALIPDELAALVATMVEGIKQPVWECAQKLALARLASERDDVASKSTALIESNNAYALQNEALAEKLGAVEAEKAQAIAAADAAKAAETAANERIASERKAMEARIAELDAALAEAKLALAEADKRASVAEAKAQTLEDQNTKLHQALTVKRPS